MLRLLKSSASRGLAGVAAAPVDVLVVGAGHNGLVASTLLARQGLKVRHPIPTHPAAAHFHCLLMWWQA